MSGWKDNGSLSTQANSGFNYTLNGSQTNTPMGSSVNVIVVGGGGSDSKTGNTHAGLVNNGGAPIFGEQPYVEISAQVVRSNGGSGNGSGSVSFTNASPFASAGASIPGVIPRAE